MLPSRLFFDDSFFKGEDKVRTDVYEKEGKIYVEMEAPGYSKENVNISIREAFEGAFDGDGSSLVGEGLAYCSSTFKNDDGRTKIVILTTDDEINGKQIISVLEAANYSKANDVKVYPIGTKSIKISKRQELIEVANTTNGNYYDFSTVSTSDIVDRIQELNKTAIVKNVSVTKKDLPEVILPYLFYILPVLFVLEWRVRI